MWLKFCTFNQCDVLRAAFCDSRDVFYMWTCCILSGYDRPTAWQRDLPEPAVRVGQDGRGAQDLPAVLQQVEVPGGSQGEQICICCLQVRTLDISLLSSWRRVWEAKKIGVNIGLQKNDDTLYCFSVSLHFKLHFFQKLTIKIIQH